MCSVIWCGICIRILHVSAFVFLSVPVSVSVLSEGQCIPQRLLFVVTSLNHMQPLNPSGHRQRQVTLNSSSHMQLELITHRNRLCATTHSHSTTTATSNHPQPLNPSSHGEPQATTPQAATGNHKQSLTARSHENRWQPLEPHSFDDPAHDDSSLMFLLKVVTGRVSSALPPEFILDRKCPQAVTHPR